MKAICNINLCTLPIQTHRYGSTGVWEAVQAAIDSEEMVVAYPVRSQTNYVGISENGRVFSDAILLRKGATPLDVARKIGDGAERHVLFVEEEDGRRCDLEVSECSFRDKI